LFRCPRLQAPGTKNKQQEAGKIAPMKRALLPLLAFFLALPVRAQTLTGFARLPASTFVSGPTSGQTIEVKDRLVPIPFVNKQPIQGFSALWRVGDSEFLALEDNGFGAKKNSADFLLRMVRVRLDFKAAQGGTGAANVISSFVFTDPNRRVPFPLVRDDRQLTGADFDPESFVVARDGSLWVGEEFGPFLLHFSASGELLEAPFILQGVASPDDPLGRTATIKSSRGFEGLALSPDKSRVYALLEGAVSGDDPRILRAFEFDLRAKKWTGLFVIYRLNAPEDAAHSHSIGEMTAIGDGRFLVIERDGLEGGSAKFKRVFLFDPRKNSKTLVADLLRIGDPQKLSGASKGVYAMPFQTIESVVALDSRHILLCNDNNFPFGRGRGQTQIEGTEFARIELPAPLF